MLPDGVLSTAPVIGAPVDPVKGPGDLLIDYERGGIALNDPSKGLLAQLWTLEVRPNAIDPEAQDVTIRAPTWPRSTLFTGPDITEASLAFDQNMRPFVAYVQGGAAKFWWFDTAINASVHTTLGADYFSPRCTMDEKRAAHLDISDIVLAYVRAGNLCVRYQRERYGTEHVLQAVGPDARLVSVGLSDVGRLQFRVRDSEVQVTAGVRANPLLSDIVADLCARVGVTDVHTGSLNDEVHGYKIATQGGVDSLLAPLMQAYFFDAAEWDGRLRFIKRGQQPRFTLALDDFAARDEGAVTLERSQEAEILRKVSVGYLDPAATYTVNTQSWERRAGTVEAKGESIIEMPVVCDTDTAAQIAEKRGKAAWSETEKATFALPALRFARLTPTDVGTLYLPDGGTMEVRVGQIEEDSGVLIVEASRQRASTYGSTATGTPPPRPPWVDPPLLGPTKLVVMNLPQLRSQDSTPGVYVAVRGTEAGWPGAALEISANDGETWTPAGDLTDEAIIGVLVEAVTSASTTLRVSVSGELYSATDAQLSAKANAYALGGSEVGQFKTATPDGAEYVLTDLIRGQLETPAAAHPAGTPFVLLDAAVYHIPIDVAYAGRTLLFRATTYGMDPDESEVLSLVFDPPTYILDGGGA